MKILTMRALRFSALVCAFSIAGIPGSSGAQSDVTPLLTPTVVTSGLENPRGIKFGPDGRLYVAEGGLGGSRSTVGKCPQVPAPIGPYTGGYTGRLSAVDVTTGRRSAIVRNLPSSLGGGDASSVGDVAFLHGTLYALIVGARCSHGLAGTCSSIDRISFAGRATPIVNLSRFQMTHPVAHPNPPDFEPDGSKRVVESAASAVNYERISESGT